MKRASRKTVGKEMFYTERRIAELVLKSLNKRIPLKNFKNFIDPCAGDGIFPSAIRDMLPKANVHSIDITCKRNAKRADFLKIGKTDPQFKKLHPKNTLVIGNPPFGRHGKIAKLFIKKASEIANHVAFILPLNFAKRSDRYLPPDFRVVFQKTLRNCQFLDKNDKETEKKKTVNCAFIYMKKVKRARGGHTSLRKERRPSPNPFWDLLKAPTRSERQHAHLRIRGSGSNAGQCYMKGDENFHVDTRRTDDWFIRIRDEKCRKRLKQLCRALNDHKFRFFNTVPNVKYLDKDQVIQAMNWHSNMVRLR